MSYAGVAEGMGRKLAAILLGVTLSGICTAQAANVDEVFDSVLATRHFAEVSIAPDGQRIVWIEKTVKNDSEYAHAVYVADLNSNTPPRIVGQGDPRAEFGTSSVTWSPNSKEFAYIVEVEPGGQSDLRIASADGSKSRSLIVLNGGAISPRWSPDGRSIALLYSEAAPVVSASVRVVSVGKDYQQQRLVLVDAKSGSLRQLSPADLFIYEYDWSPDNRQIVITAASCCTDAKGQGGDNWWTAELFRLDVESGNVASIFKPKLQIASPKWSPDGGSIAFIGGLMSDFIAPGGDLFVVRAGGGEPQNVTPGLKASITGIAWTEREDILTTQIVGGEGGIVLVHTSNGKSESLWQSAEGPFNGGLVFGISLAKDGRTAAAVRQSFDHAPEVWAGPVGQWRQISSVNKDRKSVLGKAESVHWTSDGMQVQGWLVYPTDYSPGKKYPMVVSVHGGPAASALSHWPAAFDNVGILSSFGYFILYPNPRGSFGQGESFTQGNVKNLGYGDLRDIEAGVKQVVGTLPVDPRRVGITGWSYGGFIAMWAITQTDMFHASVAGPGVSDWESYYGQTDVEKWVIPYFGSSAYDDPGIYAKSSPVRFVKNVRAPTLFYVGNQDSICPAPQSFQLWRALRHHSVETELLFYSNEGHGITQPADQRDLINRTAQWFDEHLK